MAVTNMTITGGGSYDPSTGVFSVFTFGTIVTLTPSLEYWFQVAPSELGSPVGGTSILGLELEITTSVAGAGTITYYGVNRALAAGFGGGNVPTPRVTLGTLTTTLAAVPFTVTFPLHSSSGQANAALAGLGRNASAHAAFGFNWSGAGGNFAVLAVNASHQGGFTGLSGPVEARGRADECPKCGGKSTRDTWVRDGFTGLMVCPHCYDEEDLVGRHYQGLGSERPGQGEG